MSEFEKVFEYHETKDVVHEGSKRVKSDCITVSYQCLYEGKCRYGSMTDVYTEDDMKNFFYKHLRNKLGGSWSIMQTLIRLEVEEFEKQIKAIEAQIPAAVAKKYEEILGPLDKINQDVMDKAAINLKVICNSWYEKKTS
jgi:hypothetical protein